MKVAKSSAKFICAMVSSLLVLSACAQGVGNLQAGAPSVQQANSKVRINNDAASLASRLIRKNQPVAIQKDAYTTQAEADSVKLTLVAEVLPPTVDGKVIQATNVYEKDNIAYVSYDVAGDEYAGGVYIIDINDPHHPNLLAEMTLDGTDFYSITAKGDHLYLPGATEDAGFDSPAMLQTMKLTPNGLNFAQDLGRLGLPSYAATDVATSFNHVFVSTGDVGGGIVRIDGTTLKQTGFYPLFDARSVNMDYLDVEHDEGLLTVFRGQPGEMQVLGSDLTLRKKIDLHTAANIPVSQSILDVEGNMAVVGGGNGGAIAVNLDTGAVLDTFVPTHGITNGVSIGHAPGLGNNLVFTAEGEDGVGVSKLVDGHLNRLGSLAFDGPHSSNMVKNDCCVVFVANGKGGLSLLAIEGCSPGTNPSPTPSPSETPGATPTATPVATPTPTATPVATPTPTATPVATPTPTATPTATATPPDNDDDDRDCDFDRDWDKIKHCLELCFKGHGTIDWEALKRKCKAKLGSNTHLDWLKFFSCFQGEVEIDWGKCLLQYKASFNLCNHCH